MKRRYTKRGVEAVMSLGEYGGLNAQVQVRTEQCQRLESQLAEARAREERLAQAVINYAVCIYEKDGNYILD